MNLPIRLSICLLLIAAMVPLAYLAGIDQTNPLVTDFHLSTLGKYLCFAVIALGIHLTWGLTGILSLGQGVFFALGGYCFGMYLMRSIGADSVYGSSLPDFMVFLDWKEYPWYWWGFDSFWFAVLMVILIPLVVATVFSFFAFKAKIKGVYFSIISQALCYGAMLLFFKNELGFGGNNGLTDFKRIGSFAMHDPAVKVGLFYASLTLLALTLLFSLSLAKTHFGKVLTSIRDAEPKINSMGYNSVIYKTAIFAIAATFAALAGALYTPQVGIINPSEMAPAFSIEMVIWVAVGGRTSAIGAILGALLISASKSYMTTTWPDYWLFFLGMLFILVTRFLPNGLAGFFQDCYDKFVDKKLHKPAPLLQEDYGPTT